MSQLMQHPVFRPTGAGGGTAELPALPERPEEVAAGRIGDMNARGRTLFLQVERAGVECRKLSEQVERFEAVVRSAGPESDFVQVAAAKAAIDTLTPMMRQERTKFARLQDDSAHLGNQTQIAWQQFVRARNALHGRDTAPPEMLVKRDAWQWCRDEIRSLVGIDIEESASAVGGSASGR